MDLALNFQKKNYKVFVITNQSGLGRKIFKLCDYYKFTEYYKEQSRLNGLVINDVKCCPHHPNIGCQCRKPRGEMIVNCCVQHRIDPSQSIFFGDKVSDMQAALNAGITTRVLVSDKRTCKEATTIVKSLRHYK